MATAHQRSEQLAGSVAGVVARFPLRNDRALRESSYSLTMRWGLALSAVLHLLLILFVSRLLEIGALPWERAFPRAGPIPDALEVVDVREVREPPTVVTPEAPQIEPVRRPPADAPVAVALPETVSEGALTNAERLQPRPGDLRLWRDFRGRPIDDRRLRGIAGGNAALLARIDALYDSLGLNELERDYLDWLLETEDGKKWGITPEAIYLGTISLPNIFGALFEPGGPLGRELAQQANDRGLIDQQDIQADVDRVLQERQEAISERTRRLQEERAREDDEREDEDAPPDSVTTE